VTCASGWPHLTPAEEAARIEFEAGALLRVIQRLDKEKKPEGRAGASRRQAIRLEALNLLEDSGVSAAVLQLVERLVSSDAASVFDRARFDHGRKAAGAVMVAFDAWHPGASDLACARIFAAERGGDPDSYRKQIRQWRRQAHYQELVEAIRHAVDPGGMGPLINLRRG